MVHLVHERIATLALIWQMIRIHQSFEFESSPDVCRTQRGRSCTLIWGIKPEIPEGDFNAQNIYKGIHTEKKQDKVIISASAFLGPGTPINAYVGRDLTFTGSGQGGGPELGFTLIGVRDDDVGNFTCSYDAPDGAIFDSNGVIFVYDTPSRPQLTVSPLTVNEGDTVTLTCSVTSSSHPALYRPRMEITWYTDGEQMEGKSSTSVTLNSVTRLISGKKYSCRGQEEGSEIQSEMSNEVEITVNYPPSSATTSPGTVAAELGQSVTLSCSLTDPGRPPATFTWTRVGGAQVSSCTGETCQLSQPPLGVTQYDCLPHNSVGYGEKATITLATKGVRMVQPSDPSSAVSATTNTTLNMTCAVESHPSSVISWTYNDGSLPSAVMKTPSTKNQEGYTYTTSMLSWKTASGYQAEREDTGGQYRCSARISEKEVAATYQLSVFYGPHTMTVNPTLQNVWEGDDVSVTCNTTCSPGCSTLWKDGTGAEKGTSTQLDLNKITRAEHGGYTCTAENYYGARSTTAEVNVNYIDRPSCSSIPEQIPSDSDVTLTCDVVARPSPTMTLYSPDGDEIIQTGSNDLEHSLNSVDCLQTGNYKIVAENGKSKELTMFINITCFPRVYNTTPHDRKEGARIGDTVVFTLSVVANPKPSSFTWSFLQDGASKSPLPDNTGIQPGDLTTTLSVTDITEANFGVYSCLVVNGIDGGEPVNFNLTSETVPKPPTDLKIEKATPIVLRISWLPGWDGGSPQTFDINYTNVDTGELLSRVAVRDNKIGLLEYKLSTGIQPLTKYRIEIGSSNTYGLAVGSARIEVTTPGAPDLSGLQVDEINPESGYALLSGTIVASDVTVTHMVIDACEARQEVERCITNLVTEATPRRRRRNIPVGSLLEATVNITVGGNSYTFKVELYDGEDIVHEGNLDIASKSSNVRVGLIVGAVCGVVSVIIIIILVVVILAVHRKRAGSKKEDGTLLENGKTKSGSDNRTFVEDANPYGANSNSPRTKKTKDISTQPVEAVYAMVVKKGRKRPSEDEDTELVDNDQYVSGKQTCELDDDTTLVDNTVYGSTGGDNKNKLQEKIQDSGIYDEVSNEASGKSTKPNKHPAPNKANRKKTKGDKTCTGPKGQTYENMEVLKDGQQKIEERGQMISEDGLNYSKVEFTNQKPGKKQDIHRKDEPTPYSSIDFSKTGKPSITGRKHPK